MALRVSTFSSLPLSWGTRQRNHARLINNTLGVSLSHTEIWANLARLGHGSCFQGAAEDGKPSEKEGLSPVLGKKNRTEDK